MPPLNEDDVDIWEVDREDAHFRRIQLGEPAGSDRLGCSVYELPPGGRSWPYHYHAANEEAIYALSGEGTIRLDDGPQPLRAGDYVALPADESGGHRVINDGDAPLRYLAISTMTEPDVTVYPDSETFGVFVGSPPGRHEARSLEGFYAIDDEVDYWGDEDE